MACADAHCIDFAQFMIAVTCESAIECWGVLWDFGHVHCLAKNLRGLLCVRLKDTSWSFA